LSQAATQNASKLRELAGPCRLCPRECGADRPAGETGHCGVAAAALVGSAGPHWGEESVLVGRGGSGTIFFAGCNLLCCFCQNSGLSHGREGVEVSADELASKMLGLERAGCVNVNFVTPTHFAHVVAEAIMTARAGGLAVPVVYNCGGYESVEALRHLEGLVEIYMPDAKTLSAEFSRKALGAKDYPERMREALGEMHRQVGDLEVSGGVARRGLLVRHLVMPGMTRDSENVIGFLADLSDGTFVNVMGQYRPCYRADSVAGLERRPARAEISAARAFARDKGLRMAD